MPGYNVSGKSLRASRRMVTDQIILEKLEEMELELGRARMPGSIVDLLYGKKEWVWLSREALKLHVDNTARLAWHLHEDVWAIYFKKNSVALASLAKAVSVRRGNRRRLEWFRECLTTACPELALCQDLVNKSKHPNYTPPPDRKASGVAEVRYRQAPVTLENYQVGSSGAGTAQFTSGWKCIIVDSNDVSRESVDVFEAVKHFWADLEIEAGVFINVRNSCQ